MRRSLSRRLPFVGRERERSFISRAIAGDSQPVLLIIGEAGIGKTFLLEEAGRIAQEQGAFCLPVIDFYDSAMHSHQGLEATIAQHLDPGRQIFADYWVRRESDPQAELWGSFLDAYKAAVGSTRAVLRFDTAERLEYERDSHEVRTDCDVTEQDAPSWEWLLERIGDLPNTTVLIAARPTQLLKQRLVDAHGDRVSIFEVASFSQEETEAYFRATGFGRQVADEASDMVERIHLLADGRPILIALALDWLQRGMWDQRLYPVGVADLRALKAQAEQDADNDSSASGQWRETRQRFEAALVGQIRRLVTPLDVAARYLALCRKGCDATLLSRLMKIDEEQAAGLIQDLLALSFVKPPRPGSHGLLFLHDQMYDLVEQNVWLVDYPDYSKQVELDKVVIQWYDEQIEALTEQIARSRDYRERANCRRQQQILIAERLYYQFDADPRDGYRIYTQLDEEAIASREFEWDHLLRNEGLWFTRNRGWRLVKDGPTIRRGDTYVRNPTIDYDCRRRWIWRHIAKNELQKAVRVAKRLLASPPHEREPELWRPGVHVALAAALSYQGGEFAEESLEHFEAGIRQLEWIPREHREPWLHPYLLGTAYLHRGLALRNRLLLQEVAISYQKAIAYFNRIEHKPRVAEAWNNLAYVYARQGKLEQARNICRQALQMREELADRYSEGLSQNTMGIINERLDRPLTAIQYSSRALKMFQEAGNRRGIILADINLGRSYRRKARSRDWGEDQDFATGRDYLEHAISLQDELGGDAEIFYKIEARNELGCLYRDRVATLYEREELDAELARELLELAEENLLAAISSARVQDERVVPVLSFVQYADCLEDLARVYYWRGRLRMPVGEHGRSIGVSSPYDVERSLLDQVIEVARRETWTGREERHLILGKAHFQYARLERELAVLRHAAEQYAYATAYLTRYSLDAPELQKTVADVCDWLASLPKENVQPMIDTLAFTLRAQGVESSLLRGSVEAFIYTLPGVSWPRMPGEEMLYG